MPDQFAYMEIPGAKLVLSQAAANIVPRVDGLRGVGHGAEAPLHHLQVVLPLGRAPRVTHRDLAQKQMRLDVSTLLGDILRRGDV